MHRPIEKTVRQEASDERGSGLVDFVLVGGQKCGTTSLHDILNRHPRVFMPARETFLFDVDDLEQHPNFFIHTGDNWSCPDFDAEREAYLRWYRGFFAAAGPGQLLGEDSTSYLASEKAPQRIRELAPNAKILVMLRDPASRTYSHYWHMLRNGWMTYGFEDSLQFTPGGLLKRSVYLPQVERYLQCFPREQIAFVVFEEFVREMPRVVEGVYGFLDLGATRQPDKLATHRNPSLIPRFPRLCQWRNRLFRRHVLYRYSDVPGVRPPKEAIAGRLFRHAVDAIHRRVNPVRRRRPPPMRTETRRSLNRYFARENRGLSEVIGIDVHKWWYRE